VRPIVSRVAARVREERQRQGVSLETLALTANVSRTSLARFERGKSSLQLETLARLVVRGLGLDWGEFMASTGSKASAVAPKHVPDIKLNRTQVALLRSSLVAALRVMRLANTRGNTEKRQA
jgi:transcriptional regulator with XRE-family HTH domain